MKGMIGQAGLVGLSSETYVFDLQKRMFLGDGLATSWSVRLVVSFCEELPLIYILEIIAYSCRIY